MVNKMTLKLIGFFFFLAVAGQVSPAGAGQADSLLKHDVLRCGSDLRVRSYAYKEKGAWKGFDADICRAFAWAVFGDGSKFKMVEVRPYQISRAFKDDMIDVMLSGSLYSAAVEARQNTSAVGLLYYDHQMFAAKDAPEDVSSMEAFKGKKVCVSMDSDYQRNLQDYDKKYKLDLKILPFNSPRKAREAFLLKRCDLYTSRGLLLEDLVMQMPDKNIRILPEVFAEKPVYAFVRNDNNRLRLALKWALNALYLTEKLDINQKNVDVLISNDDVSTANLLGEDDLLWGSLGLSPSWVRHAVAEVGNMNEIYERNLGSAFAFKLNRGKGRLIENGGVVHAEEFR